MNEKTIKDIVSRVVEEFERDDMETVRADSLRTESLTPVVNTVPVEASARHIHLSREDCDRLFGPGYTLKKKKDISQPGQYLCEERVTLIGPKGQFTNVAVLGPIREHTQIEISLTDSRTLGVKAPVNLSGDLSGAADLFVCYEDKILQSNGTVIVARNHLHMTEQDAAAFGLSNGERVRIKLQTGRPMTFDDVIVRVTSTSALAFHIDYDEANACGYVNGMMGIVQKKDSREVVVSNLVQPVDACNHSCCAQTEQRSTSIQVKPAQPKIQGRHLTGKLLTERDLYNCLREEIRDVTIDRKTILTPMAKDYAKTHEITIHYI